MSNYTIKGETGEWEVVIGLEVHAQVTSNARLFSGAATAFGAEPNTQVSLVDAAMPGMLPVINEECVRQAVRTGLGLKAQINKRSIFDRKNYFYPDLPQGYQISQYKQPVVGEGEVRNAAGDVVPAATALADAGLQPATLRAKFLLSLTLISTLLTTAVLYMVQQRVQVHAREEVANALRNSVLTFQSLHQQR